MRHVAKIESVSKNYSGSLWSRSTVQAVDNVDLSVRKGESLAILGPNGAGKTTLVKCLLGIAIPDKGSVRLLGGSPHDPSTKGKIGVLPEGVAFPSHLSARNYLSEFGKIAGVPSEDCRRRTAELLNKLGLKPSADRNPKRFSKGMKTKLGIAQSLINRPQLLVLDEPTEGLDPSARDKVRELIAEHHDRGGTIILNSHNLTEVERIAKRTVFMRQGKIINEGSVEDLVEEYEGNLEEYFLTLMEREKTLPQSNG
ncbi:MAG: ABC transporter ATP-binding protein [Bacteroidetes bacterium QH_8_67_23]|nr:MAG: ABC transporter ATP-binding protein [Bacteroidetes bacterium QH_8_67_23]